MSKVLIKNVVMNMKSYPSMSQSFCCTGLLNGSGKTTFADNLPHNISEILQEREDDLRNSQLVSV